MRTLLVRVYRDIFINVPVLRRRLVMLALTAVMLFSSSSPSAVLALATSSQASTVKSAQGPGMTTHKTSTTPSVGKINNAVAAPPQTLHSSELAAADTAVPDGSKAATFLDKATGKINNMPLGAPGKTQTYQPHELVQDRTATSSDYLNRNGTITKTNYVTPHFYKNGSSWSAINTDLVEDKNAADSGNIFGKALGDVESWFTSPNAYEVKANSWQGRFASSDFAGGMVRIKQGKSQMGFSPVDANKVEPVVSSSNGEQIVRYNNLWKGVDVEYTVESDQIKEAIILNDKNAAASQVQFKMVGAKLQKAQDKQDAGSFSIVGALGNQFDIAPSTLFLNNSGPVSNDVSGLTEQYTNGALAMNLSSAYLQKLPAKSFPAVIDPTVYFGNRSGGDYESFETNGYNCVSTICDPYAGSLYDSNNNRQYWRSAIHVDYSAFQQPGTTLNTATLHLTQRSGVSWWTGYTGTFNYQVGNATCLSGYNCMDGTWYTGNVGSSGDITVTNIYQNLINTGNWGGWLMIAGDDGAALNWKAFDPDNSYVTFTYNNAIPAPSFNGLTSGQVFSDPQVSLKLNPETNPNNSTPLQYEMEITSSASGGGLVVGSQVPQNSTSWTVPDGVLQDGTTYYAQAISYDSSTGLYSPWSAPVPFKIDMREGQDQSQTYDTLGPVSVDLATGNLETGNASHTMTALAGSLGVGLSYNSSLKSRPGLVGSYWKLPSGGSGIPSSTPDLQRVDQNIDFDWNSGSPANGTIDSTYFAAQWNGDFVAPVAGTYFFGAINDDNTTITVNGQQLYSSGGCYSGPCYGSSITLTAGQVVSFQTSYDQVTGPDYVHIYVKGAVNEQVVPQSWFQTGVRAVQQDQGLVGHYYTYTDNGNPPTFPTDNSGLFLSRTDQLVSFNWQGGSPIPYGPTTDFMVRWTGYLTVPVTGSYVFGTKSDDGSRINITMNGSSNLVYNNWQDSAGTPGYGSAVTLNAGQSYPITVDYYQHGGASTMDLLTEPLGGASQVVPSSWLSPQAEVLPSGWDLSIDPDGSATYTQLTANENNAILSDSAGDTYDYVWNGSGYTPPTNSNGNLVRNNDGTFTLQDSDGKTYVFDASGTLTSLTDPVDDQHPAALQYTYGSVYSGGPVTIQKITDGVNSNRYAQVYYSGASQCGTPPSGFGTTPANMLCALQTSDGRTTYFYYDTNGNLAEIVKPGNDVTTYQYQSVSNASGQVIGYQLAGVRNDLTNDAIAAGLRANDESTYAQIGYDVLGRATSVTEPAANAGDAQIKNTIEYLPGTIGYQNGNPSTGYYGATQEHVVGAAEPNGYTERVEYDNLFRTTKVYNVQGLAATSQWDPAKDLLYATTSPTGQESTTIYDDDDRAVTQYGPAPSSWFTSTLNTATGHTDITPQSAYASQVAHTAVSYDQGMTGLAVAYMAVNEPSANQASLVQSPLAHSTNIATDGTISNTWGTTSPIPNYSGNWGFSMTGTMRLPTAGQWAVGIQADEGFRMWIDNQLVIDHWKDNTSGSQTVTDTEYFNNAVANSLHTVRIDYYHLTSSSVATFGLTLADPSGDKYPYDMSNQVAQYFSPNYSLTTSATSYDATYGNSTVDLSYGNSPNLAQVSSATVDPSGLNLTSSATYETPGSGYLRQTAQTSAGGATTTYSYYGANDTATNPCVSGSAAAYQAGMLKTVTTPGANNSAATGITTTSVYDASGNIVATRTNQDGWDCKTYDARGRLTQEVVPAYGGSAARTITYNYDVGGNPLVTSVTDADGTITTTTDLLGRTVSYTNTLGDTTTTSYDTLGRVTSQTSAMGTETYGYNNYNQLTDEKLNGTDLGQFTYDQYGRLQGTTYPAANNMTDSIGYNSMTGSQNGITYNLNTTVPGPNLIQNPSFEQHTVNASLPDAWTEDNWGTNTAAFSYPNNGHTGSYSARIDMSNYSSGDAKWDSAPASVVGSTNYTFSDYYESNVATIIDAKVTHTNGSVTYQQIGSPAASSSGWTQGTYSFTTPSDATQVVMLHLIQSNGYLQIDDMSLQRTTTQGTDSVSNTEAFTQSGKISSNTVQDGSTQLASTYGYDAADRLTSATVGSNTYSYGFGAQSGSCGTGASLDANAGMDGNRTSQTINGATTTYCYNYASQLVSSSDPTASGDQYNSHGDLTQIGSGSTPLYVTYDSSDRNFGLAQYNSSGNGAAIYYNRDADGRITYRENDSISNWNWNLGGYEFYGYTGSGSSASYVYNSSWQITAEYVEMPDGVTITINPRQTTQANKYSYNLPSMQGNTLLTANGVGANTSTGNGPSNSFAYDPFGNPVPGSQNPQNADFGSFGYKGEDLKLTESLLALAPVQMGARVYFASIGRFATMDPIPGGNVNPYVYPPDPINLSDVSGMCVLQCTASGSTLQPAAPASYYQPAASASQIQPAAGITRFQSTVSATINQRAVETAVPAKAPVHQEDTLRYAMATVATVNGTPLTKIASPPPLESVGGFDLMGAGGSAMDWYAGGALVGGIIGCVLGGAATIEFGGVGCYEAGETAAGIGRYIGGALGWLLGGYDSPHADDFGWGPDGVHPAWEKD
ncbi:MAG TPA: PA14 domain-containing protein [Candidatus Saccharimonadales bacterium]